MRTKMTHGSLFSGLGGFDLAAEWAGWENKFNCEIEEFPRKILKYYWPDAEQYTDIRERDFTVWRGLIDVLTGGFPCQPFSQAGLRRGTDDPRHLWPESFRAIREISPRWFVGENVFGIVNWNAGMVFEQVCADLEAEGYGVQPFVLPASGVDAPHRRYRTFFIAYRDGDQCQPGVAFDEQYRETPPSDGSRNDAHSDSTGLQGKGTEQQTAGSAGVRAGSAAYSGGLRLQGGEHAGEFKETEPQSQDEQPAGSFRSVWEEFPTQSPICSRNDGFPCGMDGITFSKWRTKSIEGFGNAIVPQVAYQIFQAINELAKTHS